MSITKPKTESVVEKFDEIFGVDYQYRNDGEYDLSEGMVVNSANIVCLIVDVEKVPRRFRNVHDKLTFPVSKSEVKTKQFDFDYRKFTTENNNTTAIKCVYLDMVAELYDIDSDSMIENLRTHKESNVYPVRIDGEDSYVMIAPISL